MDEDKKTNRWAKTLDEAGLLDEIEDGWSLPPGPPDGSTITVKSSFVEGSVPPATEEDSPADPPAEDRPTEEPAPEPPPLELAAEPEGRMPATPVERLRSSDPSTEERFSQPQPPLAVPHPPSEPPDPIPISNARATAAGMPRTLPSRPPAPPSEPPPDPQVVEVHGRRISVMPEPAEDTSDEIVEPIYDDPPEADAQGILSSVAPSERITEPPLPADQAGDSGGGQLKSVPPERPADAPVGSPHARLGELFEVGDYSGALAVAEEILGQSPGDAEATSYAESCREVLLQMFESRIGAFEQTPRVVISEHDLLWRSLDPTAGFVLSQIDGMCTFEDIVDISGLPRFEICRILDKLLQDGIIE